MGCPYIIVIIIIKATASELAEMAYPKAIYGSKYINKISLINIITEHVILVYKESCLIFWLLLTFYLIRFVCSKLCCEPKLVCSKLRATSSVSASILLIKFYNTVSKFKTILMKKIDDKLSYFYFLFL